MCGSSGKRNSIWEYMVRKFIAHAYDKPSGTGMEVEERSPQLPRSLFPLDWEVQSPRHFKGAWYKTSWPTAWPIHGGQISFLTSGIFPQQPQDKHSTSVIRHGWRQNTLINSGYKLCTSKYLFIFVFSFKAGRWCSDEKEMNNHPENVNFFQGNLCFLEASQPKQTKGWDSEEKTFPS